jgi:hypothetical protein
MRNWRILEPKLLTLLLLASEAGDNLSLSSLAMDFSISLDRAVSAPLDI